MIVCPKCKKQLEDGTKFCDSCGAQIFETVFCPNCGKQTSTEFAFCQNCGTAISEGSSTAKDSKSKVTDLKKLPIVANLSKIPKKTLAALCAVAVAAILLIIIIASIASAGKAPSFALYIKDKELMYNNFSKDPMQVTSRLVDGDVTDAGLVGAADALDVTVSKDGKTIFFPDRISTAGSSGFSLYYRSLNKPKKEAQKIDSDVAYYIVNESATLVTYAKINGSGDSSYDLYRYNVKKDEKDKIDNEVTSFYLSEDGKTVVYRTADNTLYIKKSNKDKEKIEGDISSLSYVTEDFKTVYYIKENTLYKKTNGKDKVKIASDVSSVIRIYDSGEIYYVKTNTAAEASLSSFILDDMKDADSKMTAPEMPAYDDPDYQAKYEEYTKAYEEYQKKLARDAIRTALDGEKVSVTSYTLCYYNGKEASTITDSLIRYEYYAASESPVIVFAEQSDSSKVKLSEVTSLSTLRDMVTSGRFSSYSWSVAVGNNALEIQQTAASAFKISSDGKTIYFLDNIDDKKGSGDLYKAKVSKKKVSKPELYDSDVYPSYARFVDEDTFIYFKEYDSDKYKGELYVNKVKADYDVRVYSVIYDKDSKKIFYYTDWNSEKSCGTLKYFKSKKSVKLSDDVHDFTVLPGGNVLYLRDFSMNNYKGDLYLCKGKKSKKIDIDVVGILPYTVVGY